MNPISTILLAGAIAAGLGGAAYAQTPHQGHGAAGQAAPMDAAATQKMMQGMAPAPSDAPSTKAFKQADMTMMHNMNVPYTGDPDVDFRTKMIPHHQGAIDMAEVALSQAKDASTKKMARKIISDQKKEIAEMQAWLKKHGK